MTTPYQEREDHLQQLASRSADHLLRGEFAVGENVAREFLELAKDASDRWHSLVQLRLGTILENAGRYEEAMPLAEAARNLHSPTDPGWYHATGLIGNILLDQEDIDSARTQFLNVLDFWPNSSFALGNLSAVEWRLGNIDSSQRYGFRALESARKADDREHMSVAHNLIGDAELKLGNLAQAEKHYRTALAISEEISRRQGISIACQQLTKIEANRNNDEAALEFGRKAVDAETEMGRTSEVVSVCYRVLEGLYKAESPEVLSGAISICQIAFEAATEPADKVWPLRKEAWFNRDLKELHQAEALLAQALTFVEESDEENAITHGMLGILKKDQKLFNEAKTSFLRSMELAQRHGYDKALKNAYHSLGDLIYDAGDTIQARRYWRQALKLAQDAEDEEFAEHLQETLKLFPPTRLGWLRDKLTWKRST